MFGKFDGKYGEKQNNRMLVHTVYTVLMLSLAIRTQSSHKVQVPVRAVTGVFLLFQLCGPVGPMKIRIRNTVTNYIYQSSINAEFYL